MKAKKVYEYLDFERGQNPKASMDIGLEKLTIHVEDVQRYSSYEHGVSMTKENIKKLLSNLKLEKKSPGKISYQILGFNFEGLFLDESLIWLMNVHDSPYRYLEYDGEYYRIPRNEDVNENANFERGKDPLDTMEIGFKGYGEDIKAIDDLLRPEGFTLGKVEKPDSSPTIEDIAQWTKGDNIFIFFVYTAEPEEQRKNIYFTDQGEDSGGEEENLETFLKYDAQKYINYIRSKE